MKTVKKKHGISGFTLIEAMVALFILSFALLVIAQIQIVIIRGNSFANRMTTAVTMGQDKIEELRGLPYNQIVTGQDSTGIYTRTWSIQGDSPVTDTKTVSLTVAWSDHQVELKTVISDET